MTAEAFPITIRHNGKLHCRTEKFGQRLTTGECAAEYEAVDAEGRADGGRVWRTAAGEVYPE